MILLIITLIVCVFFLIYITLHNKITFLETKLNKVEELINSTLITRTSILKDTENLVKEILKTNKIIFDGIEELSSKNFSMMELDRKLLVYVNEFYLIKDKYEALKKNDEFEKLYFSLNETEDHLKAYKEFYNDNVEKYNKLIKSFPLNLISFIKRRKEKEFFDKKSINDNDYNSFKY